MFHIAGPSGVGKSLTARAVARAMMENTGEQIPTDEWCGVRCGVPRTAAPPDLCTESGVLCCGSIINGHYYSSREASRIRKDGQTIMDKIGSQLLLCPRSVVIMDDIQHMDARLLQTLATAFDDAFPHVRVGALSDAEEEAAAHTTAGAGEGKDGAAAEARGGPSEVSTAAAIFILVSDLGEAALDPTMSREEARTAVRNATRVHWPEAKLPKFVSDVVPFQPLSAEEMEHASTNDTLLTSSDDDRIPPVSLTANWTCGRWRI